MESSKPKDEKETPEETEEQKAFKKAVSGLKLRGIGPALMGGRIADIAVHPTRPTTWYVAVGSGGLWKTINAGTTWQPVFDKQASYSLGCVTIDANNPETIWVGTGENVSGRHVAWGDGVYRSLNAGQTWERMGLEKSEHISRIIIDPRDSRVVFVAAEGPLWSSGGERGLYKTIDGGKTWEAVLEIDAETGVTDVLFAPDNPDTVYAAAFQRRRHIWSYLAGGPGSGIYKSTDNGATWRKITEGLPKGEMGKIGLAVTPANPELVYATIEADEKERGFYRSQTRGESWELRNPYLSSGTGPHYYQEIEASPTDPDRVYQMDVFVHVTRDGGKTFNNLETGKEKHSDNHALWIDPKNGDHLLVGTDGGLYESFDEGTSWRHFPNLPVSQFYRLALDSSEPFYNVMGGAQDLGTLYGPSRTLHIDGVRNQDWYVPLGADGYHVAFDPSDPHTFYLEWQNGNIMRYDRHTMELQDIKPHPEPGDPPERWNWDTPIFVSPHNSSRLYVGSQRLWRSDDRGDSWKPVSGDLTHDRNRYELAMAGRVQSVDALYDHSAMSQYANITRITESPLVEGLLYVGTDDGVIQVSENGGKNWRKGGDFPDVPEFSFINDVEACRHDPDTVFAVIDAHKTGDYQPHVFESHDRGRTWKRISGDLPENTIGWTLEQDHEVQDLLFLGTEFGLYYTPNRGTNWYKLDGDVPTIAFRDIQIQRRDNDLVGATFGRGFYVLDDYTPLRTLTAEKVAERGTLFPVRDAWWYIPYQPMQARGQPSLGSSAFRAPNPPFGAVFTYHLNKDLQTAKETRHETEKKQKKAGEDTPFPGWDRLREEALEGEPLVLLVVRDADGQPVRRVKGPTKAGLHRVNWDLRLPPPDPVELAKPEFESPWMTPPRGPLAAPGHYTVELVLVLNGVMETLGEAEAFEVKPVPNAKVEIDFGAVTAFQRAVGDLSRQISGAAKEIDRTLDRLNHLQAALLETPQADSGLYSRETELRAALDQVKTRLVGDEIRQKFSEPEEPSVRMRVGRVAWIHWDTRQPPTGTQQHNFELAQTDFSALRAELTALIETDLAQFEADLEAAGAPWTPGRRLPR